jgi:hypothetical protein
MAIAVVRANSLLICGSRDRQRPRRPLIPDDGAALGDWQTWQDRQVPLALTHTTPHAWPDRRRVGRNCNWSPCLETTLLHNQIEANN